MPIKTFISGRLLLIVSFIFLASLVFSHFAVVSAIITPLDKAQADYAYQTTKYIEAKDKYENSKLRYLTFKTITSKNEVFQKTKEYLIQIDNVYIAYLFLVDERTNTISWDHASTPRDDLHKQIEDDINYFQNNQKEIDATKTLEDLPQIAKNIQAHIETKTLKVAYDILTATDLAQIEHVNALFRQNVKLVDEFVIPRIKEGHFYDIWKAEIGELQNNLDKEIEILKTKPKITRQYKALNPKITFDTQKTTDILSSSKSIIREILKFI